MQTLYLNSAMMTPTQIDETMSFYTLYLFSEKVFYCCEMTLDVLNYRVRNKWDDNTIIELNYALKPEMESKTPKAFMKNMLVNVKKIKKRKNKRHDDLRALTGARALLEQMRQEVILEYENFLSNAGIFRWIDIFEDESVVLVQYVYPDTDDNIGKNYYSEMIKNFILTEDVFHFFNTLLIADFNIESFGESNFKSKPFSGNPEIFSFHLCEIPLNLGLTTMQMKLLKTNIQKNIQTIFDMLIQFRDVIGKENFNENTREKAIDFFESIKPHTKIFQQQLNDEIYIQQTLNSFEVQANLGLRVAVTSLEVLTRLYENNKILIPYLADALRKELAMHTDIKRCCVFFFWA